jgi:hypothetical protein
VLARRRHQPIAPTIWPRQIPTFGDGGEGATNMQNLSQSLHKHGGEPSVIKACQCSSAKHKACRLSSPQIGSHKFVIQLESHPVHQLARTKSLSRSKTENPIRLPAVLATSAWTSLRAAHSHSSFPCHFYRTRIPVCCVFLTSSLPQLSDYRTPPQSSSCTSSGDAVSLSYSLSYIGHTCYYST